MMENDNKPRLRLARCVNARINRTLKRAKRVRKPTPQQRLNTWFENQLFGSARIVRAVTENNSVDLVIRPPGKDPEMFSVLLTLSRDGSRLHLCFTGREGPFSPSQIAANQVSISLKPETTKP